MCGRETVTICANSNAIIRVSLSASLLAHRFKDAAGSPSEPPIQGLGNVLSSPVGQVDMCPQEAVPRKNCVCFFSNVLDSTGWRRGVVAGSLCVFVKAECVCVCVREDVWTSGRVYQDMSVRMYVKTCTRVHVCKCKCEHNCKHRVNCKCQMSNVKCPMSNVKCPMSMYCGVL